MINVRELRIGNLVSFKNLWIGEVASISFSGLIKFNDNGGCFDNESLEPIRITKKLLYELGAEDFADGQSLQFNNRLISYADCRDMFYDSATIVDIPSVHHLQNLHFILTGKELEINPPKFKDQPTQ